MLYIISFQSISCSEASPTSPRPHKGPPEGVSIGHPLNLPPGFPHVAQLGPLAGLRGDSLGRSSGRLFPSVFPSIFHPGFPHVLSSVLRPVLSKQFSSQSKGRFSIGPSERVLWQDSSSVFPSIFHPVSNTLLNSVLWAGSSPQSSARFPSRCLARPSRRFFKTILETA